LPAPSLAKTPGSSPISHPGRRIAIVALGIESSAARGGSGMKTTTRLSLALGLTVVALALVASLVASLGELHGKIEKFSSPLAIALVSIAVVAASVSAIAAARLFWKLGRSESASAVKAPTDIVKAAEVQAEKAQTVVDLVQNPDAKTKLQEELATLRRDREHRRFHVVVFGTGSAGKTSLINALLGTAVGKTEATMGTTRSGETHSHTIEGVDGTLVLTDTPGLSEIGEGGSERESEARDLAARADLLLFVVDHDLTRSEFEPLSALARQGKRSIVILNKRDRFLDEDRKAILAKLKERLTRIVPPNDVISVAAAPRPIPVKFKGSNGDAEIVMEPQQPDLADLEKRIALILKKEGDSLRAGNLLLRAHLVSKSAQDQLHAERAIRAKAVVDKFQWITAATVFTNPIPALDLMATGAVQFQMISEIAGVYGVELSTSHVKMIGSQMVQMLLKLGMVEAATSLIAGMFKASLIGYAAGGAVQVVTMAYLTHISGLTFSEYFAQGQNWGDGGMQAALVRQFDLNSRAEFLQEFAKQAVARVINRVKGKTA
jgi:small GTP-binding protein